MKNPLHTHPRFLLTKWYLDCVSENGDAFIAYTALLQWKGLKLHYASVSTFEKSKPAHTKTTLLENSPPALSPDGIRWCSAQLKVEGNWVALSPPIELSLIDAPNGYLCWKCFQPRARASIHLDKNHHIEGFGYVERIDLSIPPWQLPINKLRWGRFLSERDALVWIDWDDVDNSQQYIFLNNKQVDNCHVTSKGITLDNNNIDLAFRECRVLREGPLVSTALASIPGITKLFPEKILKTHECKWLSKGQLKVGNLPSSEGWAIHEVVNFS